MARLATITDLTQASESDTISLTDEQSALLSETLVLIADDMAVSRTLLSRLLYSFGVRRPIEAADGQQAISYFESDRPQMVFLDIDMPRLDGFGVLQKIRAASAETFVCLVSANSTAVNVKKARDYKVDGFLAKPYTTLNVKRVLNRYVARLI